mmetsp:Transcript_8475/g.31369  ORF Transcript_8475/g.31369 Transcript_8475/m.31369 type:complete len:109 (-) Transcript_8475:1337-1663(-)
MWKRMYAEQEVKECMNEEHPLSLVKHATLCTSSPTGHGPVLHPPNIEIVSTFVFCSMRLQILHSTLMCSGLCREPRSVSWSIHMHSFGHFPEAFLSKMLLALLSGFEL